MQGPTSNMNRRSRSRSSSNDPPRAHVEAIDPEVINFSTHSPEGATDSTAASTNIAKRSEETVENDSAQEGVTSSTTDGGCAAFCRCCCYVPCVGMRQCCKWFVCKKKKSRKQQPSTPKLGGSAQVGIVDETIVLQNQTEEQKIEQHNREETDAIEANLEKRWNNKMSAAVNLMREVGLKFSLDTRVMRMLTDMAVPKLVARHSTGIAMHNVTIRDADLGPGMPGGEWYIPAGTQHSTLARFNVDKMFHKDQNVILYLHGGAMCLCSHKTHREMLLRLVGATGMILLAIEYRRPPESPWPIPVDDCFNVYKMLSELEVVPDPRLEPLEEGVVAAEAPGSHTQRAGQKEGGGGLSGAGADASEQEFSTAEEKTETATPLSGGEVRADYGTTKAGTAPSVKPKKLTIYVAGDSAGGTLAVAVARRAKEAKIRMPETLVLISPWVDFEEDEETAKPGGSFKRFGHVDFLPPPSIALYAKAYAGRESRFKVSPINFDLRDFPPMLVLSGEYEMLHDQQKAFVRRARGLGVPCAYSVGESMVHVYPLFGALGVPEALKAYAVIADFIKTGSIHEFRAIDGEIACPHVAEVLGNGGEPSTKGDFEDSANGEVGSDGGGASRKRNSSFSEAI